MAEHWYTESGDLVAPQTKGAYPSVTTILDAAAKPGIEDVYRRMGFEDGDELMEKARDRGSRVHKAIEDSARGVSPDYLEDGDELFLAGYDNWCEAMSPAMVNQELFVRSKLHRFSGTIDIVCVIEGQIWIVDTKLTSQHRKEHGMQLKAYQQAFFETYGVRPRTAVLKLANKTQKGWQWKEYKEPLRPFLGLKDYFMWTVRKRKAVVVSAEEMWSPVDLVAA